MTARVPAAIMLAAAWLAQDPPAFRSRVEAVRLDVLVTEGGRIVRGLGAGDFEIRDNGVAQQVDFVTFERLPLNVVLALDVSDSVAGERLRQLRGAGASVLDALGPDDRAGLITFTHRVALEAALDADRGRMRQALERADGTGRTALVDASHAGLVMGESDTGRSVLILFSDGLDTASWMREEDVLALARRSEMVVYSVSTARRERARFSTDLAAATGGTFIELRSMADVRAAFLQILDEFRQRYVLSYTPRRVSGEGWHRLEVRVKGRRATVQARPGYFAR